MYTLVSSRASKTHSTDVSGVSNKLRMLLMNTMSPPEITVRVEDAASDKVVSTFNVEILALVYQYMKNNVNFNLSPVSKSQIRTLINEKYDIKTRGLSEEVVLGTFLLYLQYFIARKKVME